MALSKERLRDRIVEELRSQGFGVGELGRDGINWLYRFATAVANAVVDEIQQNAETSEDHERIL